MLANSRHISLGDFFLKNKKKINSVEESNCNAQMASIYMNWPFTNKCMRGQKQKAAFTDREIIPL